MSVTCVLTMATELAGSKRSLPANSQVKAIDAWMNTCLAFVFAALVEYAFVNSFYREEDETVEDLRKRASTPTSRTHGNYKQYHVPLQATTLSH